MDGAIGWVAVEDLFDSVRWRDEIACRAHREIDHGEQRQLLRIGVRQLVQCPPQAAFFGFEGCAGVPGDQAHYLVAPLASQASRSVDRMEAGLNECLAVANVMEPGRNRYDLGQVSMLNEMLGQPPDRLNVRPTRFQAFKAGSGERPRVVDRVHASIVARCRICLYEIKGGLRAALARRPRPPFSCADCQVG